MRNFGFWQRGQNSIEHLFSNFVPIRHLYICRESSTNSPLFMQNKPNFPNTRMNVTPVAIKNYSENDVLAPPKTNPIQTQFKAKTKPIGWTLKMNITPFITSDYIKKRSFSPKKTNPIQTQFKPNSNPNIPNFKLFNPPRFVRTESRLLTSDGWIGFFLLVCCICSSRFR